MVLVGVVGCSSGHDDKLAAWSTKAAASAQPTRLLLPSPSPSQTDWPRVGEQVRDGNFAFVVTKYSASRWAGHPDNEDLQERAQNVYLMIDLQITNVGNMPQTFYAAHQKVRTPGREFAADQRAAVWARSATIDINPGNTADAALAFDLPPDLMSRGDSGYSSSVHAVELHDSATSRGLVVDLWPR